MQTVEDGAIVSGGHLDGKNGGDKRDVEAAEVGFIVLADPVEVHEVLDIGLLCRCFDVRLSTEDHLGGIVLDR